MDTTSKLLAMLIAGSPLLAASTARAQLVPEEWKACSSEIQQYCADVSGSDTKAINLVPRAAREARQSIRHLGRLPHHAR